MIVDLVLWAHVMGACVLIGTGAGIAFFMLASHLRGTPAEVAHVAGIVVLADFVFTATAAVAQPVTGALLVWLRGWSWDAPWLAWSIGLYVAIGALWLPVVWIQMRMHRLAQAAAAAGAPLPSAYRRLFRIWCACGVPAFAMIAVLLWLMLTKPG